jgi:2-polyprenyl-3-methyl-5-hydroxy-6-metoxy-1,4-benzoquinol methylase
MTSKVDKVKSLFEIPDKYLCPRQFDIRIRVETVQHFTENLALDRVLDIGCGDGSISLPLLGRCNQLTLLDLSTKMLDLARQRVPSDRLKDVDLINGSFTASNLTPQSFDLILCVGVLAHVDSPAAVMAEIVRLAKPCATVILEFTDSFHFWGLPVVLYQKALKLLRPEPYALNRLSRREIVALCHRNNLKESGLYRYGLPPLGTSKFAGQDEMYKMTRNLFGPSDRNRNAWMGNQFIYRLQKA